LVIAAALVIASLLTFALRQELMVFEVLLGWVVSVLNQVSFQRFVLQSRQELPADYQRQTMRNILRFLALLSVTAVIILTVKIDQLAFICSLLSGHIIFMIANIQSLNAKTQRDHASRI